ncbi:MAG: hypothetical protein ACYCXG_08220 [Acidiferrobacter sp.]
MIAFPLLPEVPQRLARVRGALSAAQRPAGAAIQDNSPESLLAVVSEFVRMLISLDERHGPLTPLPDDDATRLGDTGLRVLAELMAACIQLGLSQAKADLDQVAVTVGDWIMRHGGRITTLEPIVNGLAELANEAQGQPALEEMTGFMGHLMGSVSDEIRADSDKSESGRPWRVLQLNRAIVATRSHNTVLMAQIFDELIQGLPEDAPTFFREGMRQMEVIDYPPQVRAVMSHYFQALAQHTLH